MALTPEAKVKKEAVKQLKELNFAGSLYYFFPATGGYGKSGVPDIIVCYKGMFVAIECKANGNKPTALQLTQLDAIKKAGGLPLVIDESNVKTLPSVLTKWLV